MAKKPIKFKIEGDSEIVHHLVLAHENKKYDVYGPEFPFAADINENYVVHVYAKKIVTGNKEYVYDDNHHNIQTYTYFSITIDPDKENYSLKVPYGMGELKVTNNDASVKYVKIYNNNDLDIKNRVPGWENFHTFKIKGNKCQIKVPVRFKWFAIGFDKDDKSTKQTKDYVFNTKYFLEMESVNKQFEDV